MGIVLVAHALASLVGVVGVGLMIPVGGYEYGLRDIMRRNYLSLVHALVRLMIALSVSRRPGPGRDLAPPSPDPRSRAPELGSRGCLIVARAARGCPRLDVA